MGKITTKYQIIGDDDVLKQDILALKNAHNRSEEILQLDTRTDDPSGLPTTTDKVYIWFRSNTSPQQVRFLYNGTTYKLELATV